MSLRIGRSALPPVPPAHVLLDLDRAAQRVDELRDDGRELHFEVNADRRVVVEVRDLEGRVVRTIRPSEALDLLSGRPRRHRPRFSAD